MEKIFIRQFPLQISQQKLEKREKVSGKIEIKGIMKLPTHNPHRGFIGKKEKN